MPTARRCQGCGATLGEAPPGAGVVTCGFCGLAHDTATVFPAVHRTTVVIGTPAHVQRARRVVWIVILLVSALIVVGALVPAFFGTRLAQTAVERATTDVTSRLTAHKRAVPPADLANLPQGGGWKVLEPDPPVGGFRDFDPVASLPWATAIAKAWASDAVLTRVDIGRVAATGAVDLGGEQSSGYRFASPGRHQQWQNETDAGSKPVTATFRSLGASSGYPRVRARDGRTYPYR